MVTPETKKVTSVYELIEAKLGVRVDFRFGEISSVGTASVVAARNDPGRVALVIVNLSANTITVRPVNPATTTQGIRLGANGGAVAQNWQDDLILPALVWNAIASGANSDIFIVEAIIT